MPIKVKAEGKRVKVQMEISISEALAARIRKEAEKTGKTLGEVVEGWLARVR